MNLAKLNYGSQPRASIIILTRNSASTIQDVLDGVIKQKFDRFEIIVVDSTSTDETINIIKKYPCRLVSISPQDFGHGKTRNYAASLAKGKFVVFLTHDSVPEHEDWLTEMLKPFNKYKVAGVYGRQIPRANENVLDKHFQSSLYGPKEIVWREDNWEQGDNLFSDANSALKKNVILKNPYPADIIVSEDYAWATVVLSKGYGIVYNPKARVIHSHSYNLRTLFKRNFDVGVSYRAIFTNKTSSSFLRKGLKIVSQEVNYLRHSGHGRLVMLAIVRDFVRYSAISIGKKEYLFSNNFKKKHLSAQSWYWK